MLIKLAHYFVVVHAFKYVILAFKNDTKNGDIAALNSLLFYSISWWTIAKHLIWSLLGVVELDPLNSTDIVSATVVRFLYGAYLIMGVVLLINMMIALLSNTYQRVQVSNRMNE